jgi:restriction system protein
MGYGGTHKDAAQRVGKSGDEGIDGIINEDRLGLDTIYLQAKRWQGTVGRPEIQKFVGALHGKQANKGVFITTSAFTSDAMSYAAGVGTRVVLVDGATLASYMIECGIGVVAERVLTVKRLDSDYFEDGV